MDLLDLCIPNVDVLSVQRQKNYKKVARYSYGLSCFCYCSRNCEELAIATYMRTVPLWLSYVDDTFTFVPLQTQTKSTIFTNTLDRRRTYSYQGIEENGKIPFLDCLVTLDNNRLRTTIYRKPTHQQVTGPVIIQLCRLSQL